MRTWFRARSAIGCGNACGNDVLKRARCVLLAVTRADTRLCTLGYQRAQRKQGQHSNGGMPGAALAAKITPSPSVMDVTTMCLYDQWRALHSTRAQGLVQRSALVPLGRAGPGSRLARGQAKGPCSTHSTFFFSERLNHSVFFPVAPSFTLSHFSPQGGPLAPRRSLHCSRRVWCRALRGEVCADLVLVVPEVCTHTCV